MKLLCGKESITIQPESDVEVVYLEYIFGKPEVQIPYPEATWPQVEIKKENR